MRGIIAATALGLGACLALGGCTVATMRGFDAMAATSDMVEVSGIGSKGRGDFRLSSGAEGQFERQLVSAADWHDDFGHPKGATERFGGARFTVAGPGVTGTLAGECRTRQAEYRDGDGRGRGIRIETTTTVLPLHYDCRFTRDGVPVGGMMLGEPRPAGFEVAERRAGEVTLDGRRLALVSEHKVDGPTIGGGVSTPLGYRFEEDGRATGMVSLNGARRIALPRNPQSREATLAAGLALVLFWDPADF